MQVEGVTVQKIIEPKLLGVHNAHNVWLCHGKYGEYLRYNSLNYSIPAWSKMENLNEPFGIAHTVKIIDWKRRQLIFELQRKCDFPRDMSADALTSVRRTRWAAICERVPDTRCRWRRR